MATDFTQDWQRASEAAAMQAANQPSGGALSAGADPSVAQGIGTNDPMDPNGPASIGDSTMANNGTAPNLISPRTPNSTTLGGGYGGGGGPRLPAQNPGSGGIPADLGANVPNAQPQSGGALQGGTPPANPQGDPGLPTAPGSPNGLGAGDESHKMEPGFNDAMSLHMNVEKSKVSDEKGDGIASDINNHIMEQSGGVKNLQSEYFKFYNLAMQNEGSKAALQEQAAKNAVPAMTLRDKAMYVIDALQRAGIASSQGLSPGAAMAYGAQGAQDAVNKKNAGIHDAAIEQAKQHEADAEKQATTATNLAREDNLGYEKYFDEQTKAKEAQTKALEAKAKADKEAADALPGSQKNRLVESEINKNNRADTAGSKAAQDKTETQVDKDGNTIVIDRNTGKSMKVKDEDGNVITGAKKPGAEKDSTAADNALLKSTEKDIRTENSKSPKQSVRNASDATVKKQVDDRIATMRPDKAAAPAKSPNDKATTPTQQKTIDAQAAKGDPKAPGASWFPGKTPT